MKPCKEVFFSYDDEAVYNAMTVLKLFDIGCLNHYDETFGIYMEIGSDFHKRFSQLLEATECFSNPLVRYTIDEFDVDKTEQLRVCLKALQAVGMLKGAWLELYSERADIEIECTLPQSELIDNLILAIFKENA